MPNLRVTGAWVDTSVVNLSEIRYAKSGDIFIAYRVLGDGPADLAYVHGFAGNLQAEAEIPQISRFHEQLSSIARLITFDRRGTGLSDRVRQVPTLETRMDDLRAVLDAAESRRASLFGTFEAASMRSRAGHANRRHHSNTYFLGTL